MTSGVKYDRPCMTSRIAVASSDEVERLSTYADAPDRNASAATSASSFIVKNTSLMFRDLLLDLTAGFEAVQERHRDVEDDDVGLELLCGGNQGAPVGHLTDDVALFGQQLRERPEKERVFVCEQDAGPTHARDCTPSGYGKCVPFLFDLPRHTLRGYDLYRTSDYAESAPTVGFLDGVRKSKGPSTRLAGLLV